MNLSRLHTFPFPVDKADMPTLFTYPFHYTPHPLCRKAAEIVMTYVKGRLEWTEELKKGKMFGVLIVESKENTFGFLSAFSGLLAGKNNIPFFVPSIYDLLSEDGFFKKEEDEISNLNYNIRELENSDEYIKIKNSYEREKTRAEAEIKVAKEKYNNAKISRERERKEILSSERLQELAKESQFQKAELKRLKERVKDRIDELGQDLRILDNRINNIKEERKLRSAALQNRLFTSYRLLNAQGEEKNLLEIFAPTSQVLPPAAAGDCAAPKLLQYAYQNRLRPIAMAEFWYGDSPKNEIRKQGNYYPSCTGKCGPILGFMPKGLSVEPNPMEEDTHKNKSLEVIYEDEYIIAVNKPSGMLSVPGKLNVESVYTKIKKLFPELHSPLIVHRLDMATSGVLLLAKDKNIHEKLQVMFQNRSMRKTYMAILEGEVSSDKGTITLPLSTDYLNRPCCKVDHKEGKKAITHYEVLAREGKETKVKFNPITGRTHQLRIHSAHIEGLNAPIKGDTLYGVPSDRLYLHALSIEFVHPVTKEKIMIIAPCPF